jgi:hypothetical protein
VDSGVSSSSVPAGPRRRSFNVPRSLALAFASVAATALTSRVIPSRSRKRARAFHLPLVSNCVLMSPNVPISSRGLPIVVPLRGGLGHLLLRRGE